MTLCIQRQNAESGGKVTGEQYTWDVTSPPSGAEGGTKGIAGIPWSPGVEFPMQSGYAFILALCCMASERKYCLPEAGAIASNPATSRKRFQELLELICLLGFTTETSRKPETSSENKLPQNSLGRNHPLAPRVKKQVAGTAVLGVIQGGGTQMHSAVESAAIMSSQLSWCPQLSCTFL